jgi:hypothetical protein
MYLCFWVFVAKTGRRAAGDDREPKASKLQTYITVSQREKLDWLTIKLKLSIAELIGEWIEENFNRVGGQMASRQEQSSDLSVSDSRLLNFLLRCDNGNTVSDFEVVDLAHALEVDEELLLRLRTCLSEQWRIRTNAGH